MRKCLGSSPCETRTCTAFPPSSSSIFTACRAEAAFSSWELSLPCQRQTRRELDFSCSRTFSASQRRPEISLGYHTPPTAIVPARSRRCTARGPPSRTCTSGRTSRHRRTCRAPPQRQAPAPSPQSWPAREGTVRRKLGVMWIVVAWLFINIPFLQHFEALINDEV